MFFAGVIYWHLHTPYPLSKRGASYYQSLLSKTHFCQELNCSHHIAVSTTHRSIFRISLLKLMPILNSLRGSEVKGRA